MKITRQVAKALSARIEKALRAEFADSEFTVTLNGGRFNDSEFKPKVGITANREDGLSIEAAEFIEALVYAPASFCGLQAHHLGQNFALRNGEMYRFDGYNKAGRKFDCIGTKLTTGKRFKFTSRTVAVSFGLKVPAERIQFGGNALNVRGEQ